MKKIPQYLEYFLEDLLEANPDYTIKPMFWSFAIYKSKQVFWFFIDWAIYFKKNSYFTKGKFKQFSYKKDDKEVLLPYFLVPEEVLENRELLEDYIESSLGK